MSDDKIRAAIYAYLSPLANPVRGGTYVGYIRPLKISEFRSDKNLKCSAEHFNKVKAEFIAEHRLNPKTGANMGSPKKLNPKTHTKADLMRHALRTHPDITRHALGKLYGDREMFASSQFSSLKQEIKEELKRMAQATKKKEKESGSNGVEKDALKAVVVSQMTSEVEKLRDENAYLKWQLLGERHGFFERWLKENDG